MIDPIRPEVKAAVKSCKTAGIKVIMITGDHKDTAVAIAMELGIIDDPIQAMTGRDIDAMTDEEFIARSVNTFVYARVQPEHKVRIVNTWKDKGYVTAMTGDGVNDSPAIKNADIGVGMGITGTDVTKNVADIVLADDNFATITTAVEEGRRIYDNIRKTIQFLLSSNLSEVIAIFTATIMGFTLFKPVHLLFINLITDSLPAIALGMERATPGIMQKPPRQKNESIFANKLGVNVIYQGFTVAVLTLASYFVVNHLSGADYGMTAAFLTLSLCEVFHAYNMRSKTQSMFRLGKLNNMLMLATLLSVVLTAAVIYIPPIASVFQLQPLNLTQVAISVVLSGLIIPIVEIVKVFQRAQIRRKAKATAK
jgi:Ca2+-transporting ATPase